MKEYIKIIISILGGLYGTAYIISFFYWLVTGNITWLIILSIPFFTVLISGWIYLFFKEFE